MKKVFRYSRKVLADKFSEIISNHSGTYVSEALAEIINLLLATKPQEVEKKQEEVYLRTYCECGCDCPNCHNGDGPNDKVENCVYCQLKWKDKGQYDPNFWIANPHCKPKEPFYPKKITQPQSPKDEVKYKWQYRYNGTGKWKDVSPEPIKPLNLAHTTTSRNELRQTEKEIMIENKINEIIEFLNSK